jgi:uncharacterized protein (TIGR01440 family)
MTTVNVEEIRQQLSNIISEWEQLNILKEGQLFVVGCSTSEVAGAKIGTSGNITIAKAIFDELQVLAQKTGIYLVFQCCEHLNRALVMERCAMEKYHLTEVSAIPIPGAGGSMASVAYHQMKDPVVVESVVAHAGMDIGDTFIGMHLKPVVVPLRFTQKNIGHAHVTYARTRPKLIGGERAVYDEQMAKSKLCE